MRLREKGEEEGRGHGSRSSSDKTAPENRRGPASRAEVRWSQEAARTSDHGGRAVKDVGDAGEPVGPSAAFSSMVFTRLVISCLFNSCLCLQGDADEQEYEDDFEVTPPFFSRTCRRCYFCIFPF